MRKTATAAELQVLKKNQLCTTPLLDTVISLNSHHAHVKDVATSTVVTNWTTSCIWPSMTIITLSMTTTSKISMKIGTTLSTHGGTHLLRQTSEIYYHENMIP